MTFQIDKNTTVDGKLKVGANADVTYAKRAATGGKSACAFPDPLDFKLIGFEKDFPSESHLGKSFFYCAIACQLPCRDDTRALIVGRRLE